MFDSPGAVEIVPLADLRVTLADGVLRLQTRERAIVTEYAARAAKAVRVYTASDIRSHLRIIWAYGKVVADARALANSRGNWTIKTQWSDGDGIRHTLSTPGQGQLLGKHCTEHFEVLSAMGEAMSSVETASPPTTKDPIPLSGERAEPVEKASASKPPEDIAPPRSTPADMNPQVGRGTGEASSWRGNVTAILLAGLALVILVFVLWRKRGSFGRRACR